MRILYGVQGTGNGHISRARALVPALRALGAQVDCVFSGRAPGAYFDMDIFGDYQWRRGLTFVVEGGRIRRGRSLKQLGLSQFLGEVGRLRLTAYDLVLNDFEPVSAWAAVRQRIPCLQISHQAALSYRGVPASGRAAWQRAVLRHFAPAQTHVGLHWHHFGQPLLPPVIEPLVPDPCSTGSSERQRILVYLPFESLPAIRMLLSHFPGVEFICFHPQVPLDVTQGRIGWRRLSRSGFQQALRQAQGVICNAGFELPSEALSLGLKLLVKPIAGQFEQQANALALTRLGLGGCLPTLAPEPVRRWLERPPPERVFYPDVVAPLARWILQGDWRADALAALSGRLWREVAWTTSRP